jgi:hypothetical protein
VAQPPAVPKNKFQDKKYRNKINKKSVKKINLFIVLDYVLTNLPNIIKRFIMKKHTLKTNSMERINPKTAGIDIGARSIFVCAGFADGRQVVREFLTFTADLRAAASWLKECGIKSVAMESTGSYWISTYELMEDVGLEVLLVNAHHLKAVPGKKTDVKDCQWIQQLHSYGLLRGSFRPDSNGVTFRAYVRQRGKLIDLASTQVQLMNKALVQMNIRLDQVFSQIAGASSQAIMRSIVAGERDPKALAMHRDVRCKRTTEDVIKALEGNFRPEHIFSLKQALNSYDFIHAQISECDTEIKQILDNWHVEQEKTFSSILDNESKNRPLKPKKKKSYKKNSYSFDPAPYLEAITKTDLTEIPGIDTNIAMKIIAEIGTDMRHWNTPKQFVAWLALCPGNKISGGRVLSSRTIPIINRARQAFLLAANTLHKSQTALGAYFRRMRARLGAPMAITATAHKLAKIVFHMLKIGKSYKEIGQEAYELRFKQRKLANLKRMAAEMGFGLQILEAQIQ